MCRSAQELAGDTWWGESAWSETRAWLQLELEEEGDTLLLAQLRELEEWAAKASARAAAAASKADAEAQGENDVVSVRAQIEEIYRKHNPDKLAQVSAHVRAIEFRSEDGDRLLTLIAFARQGARSVGEVRGHGERATGVAPRKVRISHRWEKEEEQEKARKG